MSIAHCLHTPTLPFIFLTSLAVYLDVACQIECQPFPYWKVFKDSVQQGVTGKTQPLSPILSPRSIRFLFCFLKTGFVKLLILKGRNWRPHPESNRGTRICNPIVIFFNLLISLNIVLISFSPAPLFAPPVRKSQNLAF